jgi:hypothetical protein
MIFAFLVAAAATKPMNFDFKVAASFSLRKKFFLIFVF